MKIAPKPTCADRYPVRLLSPVIFDGNAVEAGVIVELSDAQAVELIVRELGVAEETIDPEARGHVWVKNVGRVPGVGVVKIVPHCLMEFPDESDSPRQRRKLRPSRLRNRLAPRGSTRLDPDAGILAQIKPRVL